SDGAAFARDTVCFDGWTAGSPVTWAILPVRGGRFTVTSIAGVAPGPTVRVRLADGSEHFLPARPTATDRAARFFGVVLAGSVTVRDVTVLDAGGHPIGAAVRDPAPGGRVESRSARALAVRTLTSTSPAPSVMRTTAEPCRPSPGATITDAPGCR